MILLWGQAPPVELTQTNRPERREDNVPVLDSGDKLESLQRITINS
jgi:hypothetical protein